MVNIKLRLKRKEIWIKAIKKAPYNENNKNGAFFRTFSKQEKLSEMVSIAFLKPILQDDKVLLNENLGSDFSECW